MSLESGKAAPGFTLADSDGNKVALKDFKGREVVLYFYPRDDTPGCTSQACAFRDLHSEFDALDVTVLGISPDDAPSHKKFISSYQLPFTLLCDPEHKVMEKYAAWGEKNMYGKKVQGVIRSAVWIGANGKVRKHWPRIARAGDHPAKVLQEIQANR